MIPTILLFVTTLILIAAALIGLGKAIRAYLRYRGKIIVSCPETGKPAAVHVNAGRAVIDVLKGRSAQIRLDQCSRWPARNHCGQECLSQIKNDHEGCLVRSIVQQWYRGRACAYCRQPFQRIHWHDHRPAVLSPDKKTIQWSDIPTEKLPEVFETHLPVCWSCHMGETFRREHPERFVDRPWNRGTMGEYIGDDEKKASVAETTVH